MKKKRKKESKKCKHNIERVRGCRFFFCCCVDQSLFFFFFFLFTHSSSSLLPHDHILTSQKMLVLYETPAGYALFTLLDDGKLEKPDSIWKDFETPEQANKT